MVRLTKQQMYNVYGLVQHEFFHLRSCGRDDEAEPYKVIYELFGHNACNLIKEGITPVTDEDTEIAIDYAKLTDSFKQIFGERFFNKTGEKQPMLDNMAVCCGAFTDKPVATVQE